MPHPTIKSQLRAKKHLGQNFLNDQATLSYIIRQAGLSKHDTVIEVGPGPGNLTVFLAAEAKKIIAIELDRDILPILKENIAHCRNVEIIQKDILKYSITEKHYQVIANIPYYLTSPILRHFLINSKYRPETMVLMIQKEVAEKICDKKKQSILSLQVQIFGKATILKNVSKKCFHPQPKVDSAILKIKCFKKPLIDDVGKFFTLAKIGFSSKRKQLAKNLSTYLKQSVVEIKQGLKIIGLDPQIRAEDVSIENWKNLLAHQWRH